LRRNCSPWRPECTALRNDCSVMRSECRRSSFECRRSRRDCRRLEGVFRQLDAIMGDRARPDQPRIWTGRRYPAEINSRRSRLHPSEALLAPLFSERLERSQPNTPTRAIGTNRSAGLASPAIIKAMTQTSDGSISPAGGEAVTRAARQ
jgi:hypothetical protein